MWVKSSKVDENDTNQYFINDFAIVTTAISLTIFKLFNVQDTMTFTSGLGATQGHSKWHHLIDSIQFPIGLSL